MIDSNIYWQQLQNAPVQGKFNGLSHMLQSYGQGVDSHTAAVQRAELLARQKEAHAMQMQAFKDKQLAAQRKQAAIDSMNYNGPMARPLEERLMRGAAYAPQVAKTLAGLHEQFNPAPIQKIVDNQVVTMGANPTATPISGFTQEPKYQIIDGQYVPEQPGPQAFKVPGFTPKEDKPLVENYVGGEDGFKNEMELRKEINALPEIKGWATIDSQVKRLDAAMGEARTGGNMVAVDQALITIFNKMLDPSSVVRESEYARTPGDLALLNRLKGSWDKISTGGAGLTTQDREGIYRMAKKYGAVAENKYKQKRSFYSSVAKKHGFDVDNIFAPNTDPLGLGI